MPKPENVAGKEWKPGQSGNPTGRAKGCLNRKTIARRWLEAAGKLDGTTVADELFLAQIKKAMGGDTMAFNAAFDSGMGKVVDKSEVAVTELAGNATDVAKRYVQRTQGK